MKLIKQYAGQPSTWRGIALILGFAGISVDGEVLNQVGTGIVGVIGLYETLKNRP